MAPTLQATWNKSAESPLGGFGRKPYVMGVWVGDDVALIIEFEAIRQ